MIRLLRYRWRLVLYRLRLGLPSAFECVGLALAIVGTWQVIYRVLLLVPLNTSRGQVATILSFLAVAVTFWIRLAHRPQAVFATAAKNESRAERLRTDLRDGMRSEVAYDNLKSVYEPLVAIINAELPDRSITIPTDANGQPCLVFVVRAKPDESVDDLVRLDDAPRDPEWSRRTSGFASQRQQFMSVLRRNSSHGNPFGDEDGENLVLSELETKGRLRLRVGTASYGQIMRTSDALVHEFALFGRLCSGSSTGRTSRALRLSRRATLSVLPWRRQVHKWEPDGTSVLLAPRSRAAGIGVSVVVTRIEDGRTVAFVARRSSRVGTYPDVLHVVPSGMVSSHGEVAGRARPLALRQVVKLTMLSEFLEECFDVEDLSGQPVHDVASLTGRELSKRGMTDIVPQLTGIAVDLLNLRNEVCARLDLTDHPDALVEFRLCWEYARFGNLESFDLSSGSRSFTRSDFVQSGLGCIALASMAINEQAA